MDLKLKGMKKEKVNVDFFQRDNVVQVSRELLGKFLVTRINGNTCAGMICETEAYAGITDRACHAFGNRRTTRTEVMFGKGGIAYVYLCYGIHHLFNIVTNREDIPDAVLIRAIYPVEGIPSMLNRRKLSHDHAAHAKRISGGPGTLSQAMGIKVNDSGMSLQGNKIWVEDRGLDIDSQLVTAKPRIGVDFAGADALLPYRFTLNPKTIVY